MGVSVDDVIIPEGMRFRAFLSYRTSDRRLAEWLHRKLESYLVPKGLVGKPGEFGAVPPLVGRIFRDRDEARASADIETLIANQLSQSQHLIVLCTPRVREPNSWVGREIELFRERRPGDRIHAVIGDGAPPDCFPVQLIGESPDGKVIVPLAADLRSGRQGGQDGRHKALIKIVAALIGVEFDDLWKREERRRRLQATFRAGVVGMVTSGIALAIGAANTNRTMGQYMDVSTKALNEHRWDLSALTAAAAMREGEWLGVLRPKTPDRRLVELRGYGRTVSIMHGMQKSATAAVLASGGTQAFSCSLDGRITGWTWGGPGLNRAVPHQIHKFIGSARELQSSSDGKWLAAYGGARLALMDAEKLELAAQIEFEGTIVKAIKFVQGHAIAAGLNDGRVVIVSGEGLERQEVVHQGDSPVLCMAVAASGKHLVFGDVKGRIYGLDFDMSPLVPREIAKEDGDAVDHLIFDPTGKYVVSSAGDSASVRHWADGEMEDWFTIYDLGVNFTVLSPSGRYGLSLLGGDGILYLWQFPDGKPLHQLTVPGCKPRDPFLYACRATVAEFIPGTDKEPERIVAGYWDGTIRMWSLEGEHLGSLPGHVGPVKALALSADRKSLLSASEDRTLRLWKLEDSSLTPSQHLRRFREESDPILLEVSDLVLGETLNFNSSHDHSEIESADLLRLVKEMPAIAPLWK